jgi:Carboxypeptidase regulatory-like domain
MSRLIRSLGVFVCALATLLLLGSPAGKAQTFRGTILGTVTNSSGAALPGAAVTIKNEDTGLTRTVTTADDGSYAAHELQIGNYTITVEKSGFKEGVVTGVRVFTRRIASA